MDKIFLVYFVNMPTELDLLVLTDKNVSMTKEGVKSLLGGKFARILLRVKGSAGPNGKARVQRVNDLLVHLQTIGEIIEFV